MHGNAVSLLQLYCVVGKIMAMVLMCHMNGCNTCSFSNLVFSRVLVPFVGDLVAVDTGLTHCGIFLCTTAVWQGC